MHDQVRGSDRGPKGDPDGGGPVGIGSHMAPHLRVYTIWGVNHHIGFYFDIRQWWGPLGDLITNLVWASVLTWLGDVVCVGDLGL